MQAALHYADTTSLTALIEEGVARTSNVALYLLPSFLLVRCYYLLVSTALSEPPFPALVRTLGLAVVLLIVLVSYQELIALTDALVANLIDYMGDKEAWQKHLQEAQQAFKVPPQHNWIDRCSFTLLTLFRKTLAGGAQYVLRTLLLELRRYLLLFSTLVGPLALVMHLLPGPARNALSTWLSMHLAFLFWGITIALLDLLMTTTGVQGGGAAAAARDIVSSAAVLGMYLLVGPLTSMYVGNMLGNALFSASASMILRTAASAASTVGNLAKSLLKRIPFSNLRLLQMLQRIRP